MDNVRRAGVVATKHCGSHVAPISCHYMFTRFRQNRDRLQVSLVETRRKDGKVRHEHVASLGSIEMPPTIASRFAFWQRLHERLARLSNRLDQAAQAKVLGDVHARVPMMTPDEQHAEQLRNARADLKFWTDHHDFHADNVENHKGLLTVTERAISNGRSAATDAAAKVEAAKDRVARVERGEDVPGGLGKEYTYEDFIRIMKDAGMTVSDIRHCQQLAELGELMPWDEVTKEISRQRDRAEKATVRRLLRRHHAG